MASLLQPQLSDVWNKEDTDNLRYDYIMGNPPFIGQHLQNIEQKKDIIAVFDGVNAAGVLDYVAAWYIKAAQYMKSCQPELVEGGKVKTAFVSTNSISQGEQVGILWNELFNTYKTKIHFAHRTFKWGNEARGNAAVHVVIIGFANFDIVEKLIFEYNDVKSEPQVFKVNNINPYLLAGKDFVVSTRKKPINNVPQIKRGNSPYDGGFYLLNEEEKNVLLKSEPNIKKYIKNFLGAKEFISNTPKWCIWLIDALPEDVRKMPLLLERINKVKKFREQSPGKETQSYAKSPMYFRDKNNPESCFFLPRVSSENRPYIPNGFFDKTHIAGDTCMILPNANLFHFGVLTSVMHMAWVKYTCGRLKSDFRYSKDIVYNNFPWPQNPTDKQKQAVETAAQAVLNARLQFPTSSLADLYNPNTMPPVLVKAHQALDKAVDACYRSQPFANETKRIEFLFELYDTYTAGLFVKEKKGRK